MRNRITWSCPLSCFGRAACAERSERIRPRQYSVGGGSELRLSFPALISATLFMASGHLSGEEALKSESGGSSWNFDTALPDTDDSSQEEVAPKPSRKHRRSAAQPEAAAAQQPEGDRSEPSAASDNSHSQQERPDARDAETGRPVNEQLQLEFVERLAPQVTEKGKQVTDKFVRDGLSRFKRDRRAAKTAKWPSVGELQKLIKERRDDLRKAAMAPPPIADAHGSPLMQKKEKEKTGDHVLSFPRPYKEYRATSFLSVMTHKQDK